MKKRTIFLIVLALLLLTACASDGQEPSPNVETLVYANLTEGGVDRSAVSKFNRTHTDVQIEVRDYFDENGKSGRERLLAEMAAGHVPDLLDMRGMPYQVLSRKGYLEDLWPWIENDPELGREGVMEAPLKAAEVDGGLYLLFSEVMINTLVGAESVVGDRYSWTLEEVFEEFSNMPEDSTILEYGLDVASMFHYTFGMTLDSYIDWETGQCDFDSERFRSTLEFVNSFPLEPLAENADEDALNTEITNRILSGRQMLAQSTFGRLSRLQYLDAIHGQGGRVSFVGYPTGDGSVGSNFYLRCGTLAMSASCRNKEAAWEFLRQILLPRYEGKNERLLDINNPLGIPMNREDYQRVIEFDMSEEENAHTSLGLYNGPIFPGRAATEEELARYEDFINHIDKIDLNDNTVFDIVWESCGPYFAGDKALDDTVALVQNRVSLYVNENR